MASIQSINQSTPDLHVHTVYAVKKTKKQNAGASITNLSDFLGGRGNTKQTSHRDLVVVVLLLLFLSKRNIPTWRKEKKRH
jgi:hypothetical protein